MRTILLTALTIFATALPATAQCPIKSVTTTSYGAGCSGPFPNKVPRLIGAGWPSTCGITIGVIAYPGSGGTSLGLHILVFGMAPTKVPLPWMGQGCALLVAPSVILAYGRTSHPFTAAFPRGTTPGTFYVQGVVQYGFDSSQS